MVAASCEQATWWWMVAEKNEKKADWLYTYLNMQKGQIGSLELKTRLIVNMNISVDLRGATPESIKY